MSEPTLNIDEALGFLRRWPSAFVHLVAIRVDPITKEKVPQTAGGIIGQSFTRDDLDDDGPVSKWLAEWSGKANIYFTVNSILKPQRGKPGKTDMAQVVAFHVDVDVPPGENQEATASDLVARIKDFPIEPTAIVSSGGGAQAFWILTPESRIDLDGNIEKCQEAERFTRWLEGAVAEHLGTKADATHNVDRIMRVPGTINVADKKKIAKGRTNAQAKLVYFAQPPQRIYPVGTFQLADVKGEQDTKPRRQASSGQANASQPPYESLNDSRLADIDADVMETIRTGHRPGAPANEDPHFHVCCQLVRAGISPEGIKQIYRLGDISKGAKGWPRGFDGEMNRCIRRAQDAARDDDLEEMNQKHAVINISGKTRVLTWQPSTDFKGQHDAILSSFSDFQALHNNRAKEYVGQDAKGNPKTYHKPLGSWWIENKHRRQYNNGFKFMPWTFEEEEDGTLNIFKGFAVAEGAPDESKFSLFMEHLRLNVCNEVEEHFEYLLNWMAWVIQNRKRSEVAVLMRSKQEGTGKGIVGFIYGRLLGSHYMQVTQPSQVIGQFNAHMENLLCLHADEALFAGDPRHRNTLWSLITEPFLAIERKGVDIYRARNFLNLIITTNEDHAVQVGATARRIFALHVGTGRLQDTTFFNAMLEQMNDGGYEALLGWMKARDLTGFNVRKVPQTEELRHQRDRSRKGIDALVEELCHSGVLPFQHRSRENCSSTYGERTNEGFWAWAKANFPELRRDAPASLARQLKAWGVRTWTSGVNYVVFPELAALRKKFDIEHGAQDWTDDPAAWTKAHVTGNGSPPGGGGSSGSSVHFKGDETAIPF